MIPVKEQQYFDNYLTADLNFQLLLQLNETTLPKI